MVSLRKYVCILKKSSLIFMSLWVYLLVHVKQKEILLCVRKILPATGIVSSLEYLGLNESRC